MSVLKLVGAKVLDEKRFPLIVLAPSAKVRLIGGGALEMLLPVSEKKSRLLPPGPTSRESRSPWSLVWNPFKVTVTAFTVPGRPDTKMFEGYGEAGPESLPNPGATIEPELQNVYGPAPVADVGFVVAVSTR